MNGTVTFTARIGSSDNKYLFLETMLCTLQSTAIHIFFLAAIHAGDSEWTPLGEPTPDSNDAL